ncbi:MAG: hypothetical protein AAB268_11645 [Elusimicrobiota bacterium]
MKPLNAIMAVLAIASAGASPSRALAAGGVKAAPVTAAEAKNPIDELSEILDKDPAARADAGKRFERFLLDGSGGKSFVGSGADAAGLGEAARQWGESGGSVAALYFVMGPGPEVPAWALKDAVLSGTFKSGMKWENSLREKLADWTGKKQITQISQVEDFLKDAAAKAETVFSSSRKQKIPQSGADDGSGVKGESDKTRNSSTGRNAVTSQYTLADMFEDGAVVRDVCGPGDGGVRRISMKLYTKRVDGEIVNEIGIFDLSDSPDDIFGRRFQIGVGKQKFVLDDRTPGNKKYELDFGPPDENGNREITLSRPGGKGDGVLKTSTSDLFNMRADQAAALGHILDVGGEEFYVLPQSGAKGALVMFRKEVIDGRGKGDPRFLEPELVAEVGERGPNGRNRNLPGKPHLGTVGNASYHLEYNKELGYWEAKEGAGDPPQTDKPTTGDGGGKPDGNPDGSPGGKPDIKPDAGLKPLPDGMPINDLIARTLSELPECKQNTAATADLARDLQGKYAIVACGDDQIILVPKSAQYPHQQLRYGSDKASLRSARFFDHYLVLEFAEQQQYLDLLKLEQGADGKPSLALSGFVVGKSKSASKFSDAGALVDALKRYMGVNDATALTEIPRRVKKSLGGEPYELTAGFADGVLVVSSQRGMIWPAVDAENNSAVPPAKGPASAPYTSLSGPANAMDGDVSSVDDEFRTEFETADKRKARLMGTQANAQVKNIALYETIDPIGKDTEKRYFVMFRYRAHDAQVPTEPKGDKVIKTFRHKPFEVFNAANPYPVKGISMQGLTEGDVVLDRVASGYKFVTGSTKNKGVLAVFQNKQVGAAGAKQGGDNCVGPVIWWGLDRDEALKACKKDKL